MRAVRKYLEMVGRDFAIDGEAQDEGVGWGRHSLTRCAPSANGVAQDASMEEHDAKYHKGPEAE